MHHQNNRIMSERVDKLIYLAEDDLDDCEMFEEALNLIDTHYRLSIFNDGEKLMQQLLTVQTIIPDLIFLDLNMPRKTGWECVKEIRAKEQFNPVPIIILTTSCSDEDISKLKKSGANMFIVKPTAHLKLIEAVRKAINTCWEEQTRHFLIS